jgi:hypothetical protein
MKTEETETPQVKSFAAKTLHVDLVARTIQHYITTTAVDEDQEVLLPSGAMLDRFRKTGTVFDVHEYGSRSIVGLNQSIKTVSDGIIGITRMSPRPPSLPGTVEWWPDSLLWLYHVGDAKGWSIGFRQLEGRNPTEKDIKAFGDDVRHVISKYRVLEYSTAPLPCNPDALTLAMKGIVSERLAEALQAGRKLEGVKEMFPEHTKTSVLINKKVENEVEKTAVDPEMATCAKCEKSFPVGDMTPVDDDFYCETCGVPDDDMTEKTVEILTKIKETIATLSVPAVPPPVKRIFVTVDYSESKAVDTGNIDRAIAQSVGDQIAKAKGVIFVV